jgi:cobyrinic acid a,c-diamide synthase
MTKKMTLNYTEGKINSNCLISSPQNFRAHEFHYSKIINIQKDAKFLCDLKVGEGISSHKDALTEYNTMASYCHLYFDSAKFASKLIENSLKI